ncbi:6-phosphofructokinase [Desulfonispora thiosulfatigenes DSM 11270]|uniref:Pyrophosphate--fructose 6-phosphate 1-phosphotransferase n=1 Tax=Desulfonispora thiosulfatigenes DSM 11270 TaxID=656914 RepID=A0A1W1VTB2_DESTI|nr:6-phosphofructokinase [Desulfonispora thiosulfatigenes]SMB96598.1 6-phosphofructokinase [Desulfonispora thiosulfatigenes DSM 11270]
MELNGNILIAQGGGPTAVINQSLAGVVLESRKFMQVSRVYGALNGVCGILNEDFLDLSQESSSNLEQVALTPSSALWSTRDKPDGKYCTEMFQVLKAHNIRYFFYIGGNDSADTVHIINEHARQSDFEIKAIHIPKTIDNDLVLNDHTPGYGSAARFVAQAFMGINLDNKSLPGVYIGVVMGRHAGFLTAAASMAKQKPDDGPHLIYLPERVFKMENFLYDVKNTYDKYGRCIIAISEGVQDEFKKPIVTSLYNQIAKDAHGNIQLSGNGSLGDLLANEIKDKLKINRVRSDTFGYLQRSFVGCVSDIDQKEARIVGEKAARLAVLYNVNGSLTIERTGSYSVDYKLRPLQEIARKTKYMPDEFINSEGNNVTNAFREYVRPLLGSTLPAIHHLQAPRVPKILRF